METRIRLLLPRNTKETNKDEQAEQDANRTASLISALSEVRSLLFSQKPLVKTSERGRVFKGMQMMFLVQESNLMRATIILEELEM